jgi:SSS family solute:Na+ symporter
LVATLLPAGIKGIVVGGLVAALMSSLASLFNSSATLFTLDFYKKFRPQSSEKHLVFIGRVATATVVVLGVAWIPVMYIIADYLYKYLQMVQSLVGPSIAAVFILGVFSKRTTAAGGLWGLVIGFALGMMRLVLVIFQKFLPEGSLMLWIAEVNWLHYCIFLFFLSLALCFAISLFTKKPSPEQLKGLTYGSGTPEQIEETKKSWNKWDVIHSLIIVGIIVLCYIYFW